LLSFIFACVVDLLRKAGLRVSVVLFCCFMFAYRWCVFSDVAGGFVDALVCLLLLVFT